MDKLKAWLKAHRRPVLAGGVAVTVAAALYARHRAATTPAVPAGATSAATTTPQAASTDSGSGSGYDGSSSGGYDGSSSDSAGTGLSDIEGLLGTIATNTAPASGGSGAKPPSTPTPGRGSSGSTLLGRNKPRAGARTTAAQTADYTVETYRGRSYDVTSRGTVHLLTPTQLARDLAAGATHVEVGARPVPVAPPKAPTPKPKRKPAPAKPRPAPKPKKK